MSQLPVPVRAAVCRVHGGPSSIETLLLAPPGPDEVRVRLEATAICHSDVAYARGDWGGPVPAVFGHEAIGRVVESRYFGVATGARVLVTLIRSCGDCRACRRGHEVACRTRFALDEVSPLTTTSGEIVAQGLRTAAFASEVVVHGSQVIEVGDELDPVAGSLLACGVITGVGSVFNTAEVAPEDRVVVVGCGGVGLNVVQGAVLAGARVIVAVDPVESKRAAALRLGATHSAHPVAMAEVVATATDHEGGDAVFVATGAPDAFAPALGLVASTGALVVVGMPPTGLGFEVDPGGLAGAHQRILGSKMGDTRLRRDVVPLLEHHRRGRLDLDGLVSGRFTLDEIDEAMAEVASGSALRHVIVFDPGVDPGVDEASP